MRHGESTDGAHWLRKPAPFCAHFGNGATPRPVWPIGQHFTSSKTVPSFKPQNKLPPERHLSFATFPSDVGMVFSRLLGRECNYRSRSGRSVRHGRREPEFRGSARK